MFKSEQEFNDYFDKVKQDKPETKYLSIDVTPEGYDGQQLIAFQTWEQYKKEMELMGYVING